MNKSVDRFLEVRIWSLLSVIAINYWSLLEILWFNEWLYKFRNNPKKISKFVSIQKKTPFNFEGKLRILSTPMLKSKPFFFLNKRVKFNFSKHVYLKLSSSIHHQRVCRPKFIEYRFSCGRVRLYNGTTGYNPVGRTSTTSGWTTTVAIQLRGHPIALL